MKKYRNGKRVIGMAIALALVFTMSVVSMGAELAAAGDAVVTFTSERAFAFSDRNDLFGSFKKMMPGDTVSQSVKVESRASGAYDIYLYARDCVLYNAAEGGEGHLESEDNTTALLDYITVTNAGGQTLNLSAAGAGTQGVYLGRFRSGDEAELTVKVELPVTLGNEYQEAEAYIDWIFYAQEYTSGGGGTDPSGDIYTVTVNYFDQDGNTLRSSYERSLTEGSRYDVSDRAPETLRVGGISYSLVSAEGDSLSGRMNSDKVIDLYYAPDEDIDDPLVPETDLPDDGSGGSGDGTGGDGSGEIPDITDIEDPLTPLDQLPETGDNGVMLSAIAMVLSGSALAALLLFAPKRKSQAE